MQLFKIGDDYDLTTRITVPSYKVNDLGEHKDYTDANYVTHRKIVREQKLKGDFTVKFFTEQEYDDFLQAMEDNKLEDGSVICKVYAMNKRSVRAAYMFIDIEPEDTLPYFGAKQYDGFKVTVTER